MEKRHYIIERQRFEAVKGVLKGRAVIFLSCMFLIAAISNVYAKDGGGAEKRGIKSERGKEFIVARDVSNFRPIWCGRGNAVLIYGLRGSGIFRHDITTGKRTRVADYGTMQMACTDDGEWLIYLDKESIRGDDGDGNRGVLDVWRYEFKTKKRQRFAIADDSSVSGLEENILSPAGLKVFLGKQPMARVEVPEPKWEVVWSQNDLSGAAWLTDSSGVVRMFRHDNKDSLAVELFSPVRRRIILEPSPGDIRMFKIDRQNRVYIKGYKSPDDRRTILKRCLVGIERGKAACGDIFEGIHDIEDFDLFPGGESVAFREDEDLCVRVYRVGAAEADCVTGARYPLGGYVRVSPDGKWLAFLALRKTGPALRPYYKTDLYAVRIENNRYGG